MLRQTNIGKLWGLLSFFVFLCHKTASDSLVLVGFLFVYLFFFPERLFCPPVNQKIVDSNNLEFGSLEGGSVADDYSTYLLS